jgi:hypothetical protein
MQSGQPIPLVFRCALLVLALVAASHFLIEQYPGLVFGHGRGASFGHSRLGDYARAFAFLETAVLLHRRLAMAALIAVGVASLGAYRRWVVFRNRRFTEKITGIEYDLKGLRFPLRDFNPIPFIVKSPVGNTFVGLTPKRRILPPWGVSWRPVYLSAEERSMHRHVLGKTGSGKTTSILWPQVLQDALAGRGVLVIDAKGSTENAWTMRSIASACGRLADFRWFGLPAWNRPELFSHTYNLVRVAPRSRDDAGGDVLAMAERVFSVLDLGDNPYFKTQAFLAFTRVCRVLRHGGQDGRGVRSICATCPCASADSSARDTNWGTALKRCLADLLDREVVESCARSASPRQGRRPCLSGFRGRTIASSRRSSTPTRLTSHSRMSCRRTSSSTCSSIQPLQDPGAFLGKVMLDGSQQEHAAPGLRDRQPAALLGQHRRVRHLADRSFIDLLNKLRDANILSRSHQTLADPRSCRRSSPRRFGKLPDSRCARARCPSCASGWRGRSARGRG